MDGEAKGGVGRERKERKGDFNFKWPKLERRRPSRTKYGAKRVAD